MTRSADQVHAPLPEPGPTVPRDWATRIEEAKKARALGQALRKGKPAVFADRRTQRRTVAQ
jgi:hypothetical protein